ncbi:U-box domain-containing protein 33-like [Durio zibethinus]|uniref:RING-type E3 ubiquitin transferase n=1 Tax=Durio zibethinus TaxID=66656 RepID=A0A6P6B016_DURZI|nr:U-box domain-containing protein 33-like [Durio zibethinus]
MANDDDTIYVAVGEDEASELTLLWTLHYLCPLQVCILFVHQPSKMISYNSPSPGGVGGDSDDIMFDQRQLGGLDEVGKKMMQRIMDEYHLICSQFGVSATSVYIQRDDVAKGLVELIHRHNIKKLVMGAAADVHFSEEMWLMSGKAQYVNENAPLSCQIWFICNEHVIHTKSETGQSSNALSPSGSSYLTSSSDAAGILDSTVFEERGHSECELEPYVLLHSGEAKAFERMNNECKREAAAALTKQNKDLEKMKRQRDEEHLAAMEQKSMLESQVTYLDYKMKHLEDKLSSAMEHLQISQKERDDLKVELENTRNVNEELLRKQEEETSSTSMEPPFAEFSFSELQEATENFHLSFKIADGSRGSVYYKCVLRHIEVVVKVLGRNSLQDPSEFQQEVDDLSKPRHPNLVTLIGACPDIWALIYEYVPNGSLEDRLNCRNDTPPLSSQTRIRIATELCSTLMFLHSSKPHSVVHGNLKPGNILLDANFGCKLSDFGARRALSLLENSSNEHPYLDPDFLNTGRLSHSLDLYPFGIILLQLLSGRSTQGIAETAKNAVLNGGNLNSFLDPSAGNWPHQVARLTHLAIRCCDINRCSRPDLASEVLEVLETMRPSSGASLSSLPESDEDNREPPSYFICPILQEVMTDPYVAADGYTYEATALQEWLADHDTSPMTNLRLPHDNLIPNYPLRSAIQHWQQNR